MSRLVLATCLLGLATTAHALPSGYDGKALRRVHKLVTELQLEQAQTELKPIAARHPADPDVLFLQGLLQFHRGQYSEAAANMDRALERVSDRTARAEWRPLRNLIKATSDATAGYTTVRSRDGRFVVVHPAGPDSLLVPYAMDALAKADRALTAELGVKVPGPIRLEIYPSAESLAGVSTLSVEEILRTGTIALCKWDRLMITSPRALMRGYPWIDTIGHEFVHLALARASRDKAPVWFQEGVAKFLERRWRSDANDARLDPASLGLLERAVRNGKLIPFERLHPSVARLPSQEDAALAFAQVATFVQSFYARHGREGLRHAVRNIATGADARDALATVAKMPFPELERRWQAELRERPMSSGPPPRVLAMRFLRGRHGQDESNEVSEERARRYLRLGDLLWARGRQGAAAVEYGRAYESAQDNPIVAARLAKASLASNAPDRAIAALRRIVERYPEHAPARAVLGAALLAKGDRGAARAEAFEALRINPFDPQPHCVLAATESSRAERERETGLCRELGGRVP